ncbi:MAG: 7,8-didemethyl-8-hydroxy-5-deazariboflavin synthase CofG [Euryarchaeota archaeon]|nr:7,8-didemethyl-8-hydroxy-5-deazariboflavin synthase CofG [Euryarchaeota archaeon]
MEKVSNKILEKIDNNGITKREAYFLAENSDLATLKKLIKLANSLRIHNKGKVVTFSKNVFIPLTNICRNRCKYCGFRRDLSSPEAKILSPEEVLKIANLGQTSGCIEALFTFGEKADSYPEVRSFLMQLGYENMIDYLHELCKRVIESTGLLPHSNPGVLSKAELKKLKDVNASMGLMLETTGEVEAHEFSPGKHPAARLDTIKSAGELKIPFTTGLLIGIGETFKDRVDSLFAIKELDQKYGHIQEIIIQNFKPKPNTPMENWPEPSVEEMAKTVALARLILPVKNIQVPPNLAYDAIETFLLAGANDLGGISPITKDYINPEAGWPIIFELEKRINKLGFQLKERLPIFSEYIKKDFVSFRLKDKIFSKILEVEKNSILFM